MINLLPSSNQLNQDLIKNNSSLIKLLKIINPIAFFLFGSFAKNQYHKDSDIDFLIIFKKNIYNNKNFSELIINLKKNISKIFNKKIDIVVMIHVHFLQYNENNYDIDTNFIYNVYNEAINIYGKNDKDLIIESIKFGKF